MGKHPSEDIQWAAEVEFSTEVLAGCGTDGARVEDVPGGVAGVVAACGGDGTASGADYYACGKGSISS